MSELALLLKAVRFSAEKHRNQRRKGADASPYINHPIEVAELLSGVGGVTDPDVLVAAILHDTIEDTETSASELEAVFGETVRRLVEEMSDDKSLQKDVRKQLQIAHAPHASPRAKLIKIADKIANVREVADKPAQGWSLERRLNYLSWAEKVVAGLRGTNAPMEDLFDMELRRARSLLSNRAI